MKKIIAILLIILLAACAPGGAAASYIPLPSDIPGAPTETIPVEVVGGSLVAPADTEGLRQSLQEQFPKLGMASEHLTPFGITYQGIETDFVVVPPILMDEQAQTFQSERLFIKLGENWQELTKAVSDQTVPVDVGAGSVLRPITVWGQGEIGPSFRPVFWYAGVTPEDVQTMTETQLQNFEFDFWPPDEIGKLMTGYEPGKPLFITMRGVDVGGGTGKLLAKVAVESETLPAEDKWQVSPDGHIYYNEAQLYGGLFTIDTEHPENTEKLWEDTVRGLWNLNMVGKNTVFLSQFPTPDSLVSYIQNGGGPVENLWIPVVYPDKRRRFWYEATLVPTEGPVDLSFVALSIYKPTSDEIHNYSPSYAVNKFISFFGASGEVLVEEVDMNGKKILKFTFRRDLLVDSVGISDAGEKYKRLALSDEKTPEENLLAATQLIRLWLFKMQIPEETSFGQEAWINDSNWNRMLNINGYIPSLQEFEEDITTLDGTPLRILK